MDEKKRLDVLFYLDVYQTKNNQKDSVIHTIENYTQLKNANVFISILNYILNEQKPQSFDFFWKVMIIFYSLYYQYFNTSFDQFYKDVFSNKEYLISIKPHLFLENPFYHNNKPLFSKELQEFPLLSYETLVILHWILFYFEADFVKRRDFRDLPILFGMENRHTTKKFQNFPNEFEISLNFFTNIKENLWLFEKRKKILYYILLCLDEEKIFLVRNNLKSLIFSLNEEESYSLLLLFLKKYKILYKKVPFFNKKSLLQLFNDTHIFEPSLEIFEFLIKEFGYNNLKSEKKRFFNKSEENQDKIWIFLKEKLNKQLKKLKKYELFEFGGQVFSWLILKYATFLKEKIKLAIEELEIMLECLINNQDFLIISIDLGLIIKNENLIL